MNALFFMILLYKKYQILLGAIMLEEDLADHGRYGFNSVLDRVFGFVNRWGTLGLRVITHDLKVFFSSKPIGKIHRGKCGLRGSLTTAATILGVLLPTVILPDLGLNLQSVYLQIMGFLPGAAYVSAILTVALILSSLGAVVASKGLDYAFNQYFETPHTKLYFTPNEIKKLLTDENLKTAFDNQNTLNNTIEFLQSEFERKYPKLKSHKSHIKLLTISDDLRDGKIESLDKYLDEKSHSLQRQNQGASQAAPLTPSEQANIFLQKQRGSPEWQRKFLLVIAKFLNNQSITKNNVKNDAEKAKLNRVLELLNLLSKPDDEIDELSSPLSSTTPMSDIHKNKAKQKLAEQITILQKELEPNMTASPLKNHVST